jgi:hypothetical protein
MNRIDTLNRRYVASASLVENGVELDIAVDPPGSRFNTAARRLIALQQDVGGPDMDDIVGAAQALRWLRITQPQPMAFNQRSRELALEVARRAHRLRDAVNDQPMLEEVATSASELAESDSAVGSLLLESILEVEPDTCIVVAASQAAATGLKSWLRDYGVTVLTSGDLSRDQPDLDQTYVVGPPRFFSSSLVTSPVTEGLSFFLPAWFRDRNVPESAIAKYAEGAIRVEARSFVVGDVSDPVESQEDGESEDEYLPQPMWGMRKDVDREPANDEVKAHKLLLSGNWAMWLDDGDRIRSLDPKQPVGERVTYADVPDVRKGTYLLVRIGETERDANYEEAIAGLANGETVRQEQETWKKLLTERIHEIGFEAVVRQLHEAGVKSADRARAWTDPCLIRPMSNQDFERLIQWLGIPVQPTFGHATNLRKAVHQVSAKHRSQLERAISAADLSELKATGHLSLGLETEGFRGILATRVLDVSPFTVIVSRREARIPFEDRGGQWLE